MTRIKVLIFALCFALLGSPIAAIASDISNALYYGTIIISNNSTANTNVATVANISTQNLIAGGYLNSTANNTVMRNTSGADVPFMPAYSPSSDFWCMFVPTIGSDSYLTYLLYTANSSGGEIRYFPASGGMTIVDNASLELDVLDFALTLNTTFVLPSESGSLISKRYSYSSDTFNGGIVSGIHYLEPVDLTPEISVFGAWVDLDVSRWIPDGATGAIIYGEEQLAFGVRMNGSTDDRRTVSYGGFTFVGVDANEIFEVYLTNGFNIYLVGYTDDRWSYNTNADDVSIAAPAAWIPVDLSALAPAGANAAIIDVVNTNAGLPRDAGLRMNGSADNRQSQVPILNHTYYIVGLDSSFIFEGWVQDVTVDFYVMGYCVSGATYLTNGVDKSLVGVAAWTDIDCSVEAPNADFLIFEVHDNGGFHQIFGFRPNGSVFTGIGAIGGPSVGIVACDDDQIVDGYISGLNTDFFLIGYIEVGAGMPFQTNVTTVVLASDEYDIEIKRDDEPALTSWASDVVVGVNMGSGILPVKIISEQTLSASVASVTFSGITGNISLWDSLAGVTSRHLVVIVNARATGGAGKNDAQMRFNGDSGNNYSDQYIFGVAAATPANRDNNTTSLFCYEVNAGGYPTSFSGGWVLIPHAFNTTNHKSTISLSGGVEEIVGMMTGRWADTSAITSVNLFPSGGVNFDTGSTFILGVVDERYLVEEAINPAADFVVDFNNIPQTGDDLVVVGYSQSDLGAVEDEIIHEINNDAHAPAYPTQKLTGRAGVPAAAQQNDEIGMTSGDNAPANEFGALIATYSQYAEGANDAHYTSLSGYHESTGPTSEVRAMSGRWPNVAAITQLELYPNAGVNFKAGSLFSLYRVPRYVIDRQELTAVAPTITFNNIPQNYQALQLNIYARSDDAIPISDDIAITLNTDAGPATFDWQYLEGTGAGPPTAARSVASNVLMTITAAGEGANEFGGGVVTFNQYTNTLGHKHFLTLSGTNENQVILRSSRWENVAAITRIDLDPVNGVNFVVGSVFELVGLMPTKPLRIDIDSETKGIADGNADAPDNTNDWIIGGDVTPYIHTYDHEVNAVLRSDIEWEYNSIFVDGSGNGNPATPTFRMASADADIIGNMTAFTPISQATAPAYALGPTNPFFTTAPNITGNFTIVPPTGTFPLAGVIAAVAAATSTPPQLPLLIIACFFILAASLTTSYTLRKFGSGSLIVKAFVIIGVMGIFVALTDWGIDFWMVVITAILMTAIAMMSSQITWR